MNDSVVISTREPLDEFLLRCQLLAEPFDENERWHFFGNKELWIAEEDRLMYREEARRCAYDRVATHRITKKKLAQAYGIFRRKASGEEIEIPEFDEHVIRNETLSQLNELWREIIRTNEASKERSRLTVIH